MFVVCHVAIVKNKCKNMLDMVKYSMRSFIGRVSVEKSSDMAESSVALYKSFQRMYIFTIICNTDFSVYYLAFYSITVHYYSNWV